MKSIDKYLKKHMLMGYHEKMDLCLEKKILLQLCFKKTSNLTGKSCHSDFGEYLSGCLSLPLQQDLYVDRRITQCALSMTS